MMLWWVIAYLAAGAMVRLSLWRGNECERARDGANPGYAMAGLLFGVLLGVCTWPILVLFYVAGVIVRWLRRVQ